MTPILLIGGVLAVAGMFLLPRRFLPVLAIASLIFIPVGFMDVSRVIGRYWTPAVIIVLIWCVRLASVKRAERVPARTPALSVLWLPVLALLGLSTTASTSVSTSLAWIAVVAVTTVIPYHLGRRRNDDVWPASQIGLAVAAVFLGALAASDYFLGINPWTALYSYDVNERVWSVFRTRTSLGHPLITATVASLCVMVAMFGNRIPRVIRVAGLMGGGVALILAVSRTSVLAVALGVAVGCIILMVGPQSQGKSRRLPGFLLFFAGIAFLLVVTNSPLLTERNESTGGAASTLYREASTSVALSMISENWGLGTGPGTSATQFAAVYDGPLENSAFQLMLSLGIPLAVIVILAVVVLIFRLALRGEATMAAALIAFSVSLVGYSAIDVNPALLAILSPLLFRAGQVLSRPRDLISPPPVPQLRGKPQVSR